jgi:hypothetical protein
MIIVLFCKGLVFEQNNSNPIDLFFGVTTATIQCSSSCTGILVIRRAMKTALTILVSKLAIEMLDQEGRDD